METQELVTFGGWVCTGRFLGKCPACKQMVRVEREPRSCHEDFVTCPCGQGFRAPQVLGARSDNVKCSARCVNAKRADCECSCVGRNHGTGH